MTVPVSKPMRPRAAVILAAGQGTRMKSPTPKVLHKVGGRAILDRVIDTVQASGCEQIVVVVGDHSPGVRALVETRLGPAAVAVQDPPLGTAHAVLAAREALAGFDGDVLVLNGDCPLLEPHDLEPLFDLRENGVAMAMLAFEPADPLLYGRVLRGADGHVLRIVEARDATEQELSVKICNAGMMVADRARMFGWLAQVRNDNAKGEYYLTDIVKIAVAEEALVKAAIAPESAVMGADTAMQLSQAEAIFQQRRRAHFLAQGVQMLAPDTVHFSWDTEIATAAVIEQFVVFAPGVRIEAQAVIRAFSHLEGAHVKAGALIGP